MANPLHHALSSLKKYGGTEEKDLDAYLRIHSFFDRSKEFTTNPKHRMLLHHSFGIFLCELVFGEYITLSTGKKVPVRWVGEQHVAEDLGFIPDIEIWLQCMNTEPWMFRNSRKLSEELERDGELVRRKNLLEESDGDDI